MRYMINPHHLMFVPPVFVIAVAVKDRKRETNKKYYQKLRCDPPRYRKWLERQRRNYQSRTFGTWTSFVKSSNDQPANIDVQHNNDNRTVLDTSHIPQTLPPLMFTCNVASGH